MIMVIIIKKNKYLKKSLLIYLTVNLSNQLCADTLEFTVSDWFMSLRFMFYWLIYYTDHSIRGAESIVTESD